MSFTKIDSKVIDSEDPGGAVQPIKLSAAQKRGLGLLPGDTLFIPLSRDGEVREPILCTKQDAWAMGKVHTQVSCGLLTGHPLEVFYAARNILENKRAARRVLKLHSWMLRHLAIDHLPEGCEVLGAWEVCRAVVSLLEERS